GDPAGGRAYLERAVAVWERQPGRDHALAEALVHLAACARTTGDAAFASTCAERALTLARAISDSRLETRATREHALAACAAAGARRGGARRARGAGGPRGAPRGPRRRPPPRPRGGGGPPPPLRPHPPPPTSSRRCKRA